MIVSMDPGALSDSGSRKPQGLGEHGYHDVDGLFCMGPRPSASGLSSESPFFSAQPEGSVAAVVFGTL